MKPSTNSTRRSDIGEERDGIRTERRGERRRRKVMLEIQRGVGRGPLVRKVEGVFGNDQTTFYYNF
jgi:hypothetical protein